MTSERSTGGRPICLSPEVVFRRVGDEAVLVPVRGQSAVEGELFSLNEVGAFIWERLLEGIAAEEIPARIVESFEVELAQAQADLDRFVEELVAAGCAEREP